MKERPILMSAPMVVALLAGTKTQTRRAIKPQPHHVDGGVPYGDAPAWAHAEPGSAMMKCPYGKRGDRLWVRETWARTVVGTGTELVVYREGDNRTDYGGPWKPGIHMFRRDCRITLEATEIRVERLQAISEADAIAEGWPKQPGRSPDPDVHRDAARDWYMDLWSDINGPGSWETNSWVWVVSFEVSCPTFHAVCDVRGS